MSLISAKTLWNITVLQGTDFDQKIISGKDEYGKCGFYRSPVTDSIYWDFLADAGNTQLLLYCQDLCPLFFLLLWLSVCSSAS